MRSRASLLLTALLSACLVVASCTSERIRSGNRTRHYVLHIPVSVAESDKQAPLMLVFHGAGSSATGMREYTLLDAEADRLGFVVAYLEGSGLYAGWDTNPAEDLEFTRELIERLENEGRIDPNRVFAVGFSSGGQFVQRLACDSSVDIAAFASVAATIDSATAKECSRMQGVSAVFLVGAEDHSVKWDSAEFHRPSEKLSVEQTVQHWASVSGCSVVPAISQWGFTSETNPGVVRTEYTGCSRRNRLTLYVLPNQGHSWPLEIGINSEHEAVTASRLVAEFFRSTFE